MLEHRIADPRILQLIRLWLRAGVLESGEKKETDRGTPQGAGISPLLANIFLHYILDLWTQKWRRRALCGRLRHGLPEQGRCAGNALGPQGAAGQLRPNAP